MQRYVKGSWRFSHGSPSAGKRGYFFCASAMAIIHSNLAFGLFPKRKGLTMTSLSDPAILKRFDAPDEIRLFEKGKFEIVRLGA